MNEMFEHMNEPVQWIWSKEDIVSDYNKGYTIKELAKRYCIPAADIRKYLKDIL